MSESASSPFSSPKNSRCSSPLHSRRVSNTVFFDLIHALEQEYVSASNRCDELIRENSKLRSSVVFAHSGARNGLLIPKKSRPVNFQFPTRQLAPEPPTSIPAGFQHACQLPLPSFPLDSDEHPAFAHPDMGVKRPRSHSETPPMDAQSELQDTEQIPRAPYSRMEGVQNEFAELSMSLDIHEDRVEEEGNGLAAVSLAGQETNYLSEVDVEELRKEYSDIFKKLDADNSGTLSSSEFRIALQAAGVPLARLSKLVRLADANRDGEIDMNEWLQCLACPNNGFQELRKLSSSELIDGGRKQQRLCMLTPHSPTRIGFDVTLTCACVYIALVLPYYVAWEDLINPGMFNLLQWIDRLINYVFILDIIVNFRTAYYDTDGELVMDPYRIAKHYLRGWFGLDTVSSFPFEDLTQNETINLQAFKLLKLGRLLKLLKLVKIWAGSISFEEFSDVLDDIAHSSFVRILKRKYLVFVQALLVTHWLACGMKLVDEGFLSDYKDVRDHLWREYLAALYWALTTLTTVGYGDISPVSDAERAYTILAMVIGGGFYGYVVGSISSLVSNSDLNASAYYDRLDLIHAWLEHHNMPAELRRNLRRFFQAFLHGRSAIKESDIWQDLSPELQKAVGQHIIHEHVKHNPLFDGMSMSSVVRLQSVLRKLTLPSGCTISTNGETGIAMYIIVSGVLEMTKDDGRSEMLGAGQSYGEEVLLRFVSKYQYNVKVLRKAKVEMIVESEFSEAFRFLPNDLRRMRENALLLNPDWNNE